MKNNQYLFSQVPSVDIPRSTFDRSYKYMTTFDSGYLIPFMVDEVLPGDIYFQLVLKNITFCFVQYVIDRFIVENNGFEPLTPCVQGRCSSQLS